jgi:hypothetical protein
LGIETLLNLAKLNSITSDRHLGIDTPKKVQTAFVVQEDEIACAIQSLSWVKWMFYKFLGCELRTVDVS